MVTRKRAVAIPVLMLTLLALVTAAGLSYLSATTAEKIAVNQRAYEMRQIGELLHATDYDNQLFDNVIEISGAAADAQLLGPGERHQILRATLNGKPRAAIFQITASNGYSGPIRMLVVVYVDGTLAGARVINHRETPGLGDRIESSRSSWITAFAGRSLQDPAVNRWAIQRDDGDFDQITGASVTSRAVTSAVRDALLYFEAHKDEIFMDDARSRDRAQ